MITKEPINAVSVKLNLNDMLYDKRLGMSGLKFGKLKDVANQYGIKHAKNNDFLIFFGPKPRMRIFVEKLHFSRTNYKHLRLPWAIGKEKKK